MNSSYNVKLDIFEGPMDLLLHLIKREKVDIYDIPISRITEQYIEYLDMLKGMNLDMAGEFVLMAATLIHIKSKMLLPVPEAGEEEDEGDDPRGELIRKLLEYRRYKDAAIQLSGRYMLGKDVFTRGIPTDLKGLVDEEERENAELKAFSELSLYDLMEAFRDIIKKIPKVYEIDLTEERFKVADKVNSILERLSGMESMRFEQLFDLAASRGEVIVTFLALLELAKMFMVKINQSDDGVIRVYIPAEKAGMSGDLLGVGSGSDNNIEEYE
ncbi:Segregation and condensation protein A [hydrothermal vent metagenome]|uniref:Segregation and condensation protein A n=1 Tax=hydrothermal vent metagenome TaxID=652676 RepID=A0A3B0RPF6_9ZZZZ